MASSPTATHLALTVIRASEVVWVPTIRSKSPNLYVEINLGDESRRTKTIKKDLLPEWNESFSFKCPSAWPGTKFIIQIKHDSSHWTDKYVGMIDAEISELLEKCANGKETELCLKMPRGSASTETTAVLCVRLEVVDITTGARLNIDSTERAIQRSGILTSAAAADSTAVAFADAATDHCAEHADLYKSVGTLVSKLNVFVRVLDAASQIHPYANFAWQLASALYKSIEHQFKVDKKVVELVHAMRDAFEFIDNVKSLLDKTKRLEATIIQLLKQTDECCLFIQKYAHPGFMRRMITLNVDVTTNEYLNALKTLKASIDSEVVVHIAFVSSRISVEVDALFLKSRLNPDEMSAFDRPQCLPRTREKIQEEIVEWASSCSDQNVFWLHGIAGSGKSTVSMTIAERFHAIRRLGAHLFFQRGKSEPSSLIRTLAYRLASFDSSIAKHIIKAIHEDNDIAQASGTAQFEKLINDPLVQAGDAMQGPVVIVLDALDECGTERSRRGLLELFREGLPILPKNFRFLITSRKELDIDRALNCRSEYICAIELEHDSTTCKHDVHRYIDHEMREVFTKNLLNIADDWHRKIDRLGGAADGLFIWASTVVKLVDCDDPAGKLNELTSKSQTLSGLKQLYDSVLRGSGISFDDEASKARLSQILGFVLLGKVPLSDEAIDKLLGYPDDKPSRLILSRLQAVLVYTPGSPIRFCHTSFRDYLSSSGRQNDPWFIDLESQKKFILSRCFDVMKAGLRFNICDLESSYIPNNQVHDLPNRVEANIHPHLEYTCLFWAQHLREAQFSHALLEELSEFLNRRFLYWLEVMSLLESVDIAGPALLHAMNWASLHNADVLALLRDAHRIINRFASPISRSTPHIYVSLLLFASMESKYIARYFKPHLPIVRVEQMGLRRRSPLLKELTGHEYWVSSVAFSPDGTLIASGSGDMTIRVWDPENGRVISGPFKGHEDYVLSIAFSPDSARIVSGSDDKTIRIWDIESGQVITGPLEGHTGYVLSVAFSPDGMHVVSGSADMTVMVWDIEGSQAAPVLYEGHVAKVTSVAFSPNGMHVISGSSDNTIRIWDVESGRTICGPLEGHTSDVLSVAFSFDGEHIVSGSYDKTIRVWDAENGECISKPFEGHTSGINSVAFSTDGKRIASGSIDGTVRIWDVETGQVVSGPFEAHSSVLSVAFSPDGTRVISGSLDRRIRIWDVESLQTSSEHFEGHAGVVSSVVFSPSGRHIASSSDDGTIRIWDAESGCAVSGPFKGHSGPVSSVAFSPDGRRVASGSHDWTIRVWDIKSGDVVSGPFKGHTSYVESVCFSPDGTRVVSGSDDRTLRIWDVESGQTISGPFKGHESVILSVAFFPDGRHVASGSGDDTIIIWDVESGKVSLGPLKGHANYVWSIALSPDGTRVVSGSNSGYIYIWNVESGQVVTRPLLGHTSSVRSVAFSRDGARVVSGSSDRTIRVWDAESGQAIFVPLEGHVGWVSSVAFSPDGRHIISGSWDRSIRMWSVEDHVFDWILDDDGWVHGHRGELLLWIPPDLHFSVLRPRNIAAFSFPLSTRLDFTNAAIGERWQECFEPPG